MSYFPFYTITPLLLSKVEKVAALRERILAAAVQVPWIPALQKDTRIRNAHSSTAIEGNPLTLEQVRAIEEGREIPATAQRAKGEGDAQAARIYAEAFQRNSEFYSFYRSMEAYRQSLRSKSDVMVLDPSSDFFKYLKNPGRGKSSAP